LGTAHDAYTYQHSNKIKHQIEATDRLT